MANVRLRSALPSVGPFELTPAELLGLEFVRQEDERQLRKASLRATWSGRELDIRVENPPVIEFREKSLAGP